MRKPHKTAEEGGGINSYLTAACSQESHVWRCSKHRLNISFWSLCCGRHSWHEHKGKIAEQRKTRRCRPGSAAAASPPNPHSSLVCLPFSQTLCGTLREFVCSDELRGKRRAAAPDIVFHPTPASQSQGVKSSPSHKMCSLHCRILVPLFKALFHNGIRQKVGHGASVVWEKKTQTWSALIQCDSACLFYWHLMVINHFSCITVQMLTEKVKKMLHIIYQSQAASLLHTCISKCMCGCVSVRVSLYKVRLVSSPKKSRGPSRIPHQIWKQSYTG